MGQQGQLMYWGTGHTGSGWATTSLSQTPVTRVFDGSTRWCRKKLLFLAILSVFLAFV